MTGGETRIVRASSVGLPIGQARELLVCIYGARIGSKFDLEASRAEVTIGRDAGADVALDDDSASRLHCRLYRANGRWWIEDLGSTNGTWVGGAVIARTPLEDGALVKVGGTIFKYLASHNIEAAYYEEIYRMAIYDGLTQIHNRRYFQEFTEREMARAHRHGRALSLLLFDVDHFKSINDGHGHLTGDYVLRELASVVKKRIRREELFARYAGDEFVVVLPESRSEEAVKFAEHLCARVCEAVFEFERTPLRVTVSIGVAQIEDDTVAVTQLLALADAALYRAKQKGRNRVAT
jgi:diguanylate cyclase (GGDEF)-like protein